jgi:hypothetical protein
MRVGLLCRFDETTVPVYSLRRPRSPDGLASADGCRDLAPALGAGRLAGRAADEDGRGEETDEVEGAGALRAGAARSLREAGAGALRGAARPTPAADSDRLRGAGAVRAGAGDGAACAAGAGDQVRARAGCAAGAAGCGPAG